MGRKKYTYVEVPVQEELENTFSAVAGIMEKTVLQIGRAMKKLDISDVSKEFATQTVSMERYAEKLSGQLLYLRLNLGKLKAAITEAAAPLGSVLLPVVNQAVNGAIRLTKSIGLVMGALTQSLFGTEDGVGDATQAEEKLESAASSAAKAVRRSLADFDQIDRMDAATGSSGGTVSLDSTQPATEAGTDTLSPELRAIVNKILALIEPLRQIDFTPVTESLRLLGQVFGQVWGQIGGILEWVWFELLVPFTAWIVEELAPAVCQTLAAALETVSTVLTPVFEGLQLLWQALKPIVAFIGEQVIATLEQWKQIFLELTQVFREKAPQIRGIFENLAQVVSAVWAVVEPILTAISSQWSSTFGQFAAIVGQVVAYVIDALYGLSEFLAGAFTGDWERAWEGMKLYLKSVVNGVIGILNGMLSKIVGALNGVIRAANGLSFTVPEWVPGLGGEVFGFHMKTISTPQIPYLAQGAVLPANRPFLAMVGDQRHGTNVEAPLSTIQEAVATVMDDMIASNLAGQETIVSVLRQILEAVLGIHLGDAQIAQAVDRYKSKMAVVHGRTYL